MGRTARTNDLVTALAHGDGVARGRALARRHGRAALCHARAEGTARRILPRIYAHRDNEEDFRTRVAAAMEWLPGSVALTGLAACAWYGLLESAPSRLRAAAPSPLHVRQPSWLTLRRCIVRSATREMRDARLVSIPEALVHAWEEDPNGRAREAIFTALRQGRTSVAAIREALASYPRVKGGMRLRLFLSHLLDGMHSFLEYRGALTVLNTPDLRSMQYQTRFVVEGNVFYVDRYHPHSKTAVEFDGAAHHSKPEDREHDAWRDAMLRRIGVEPVHLPYADVMRAPADCRARVRATIAARGG